MKRIILIIFLIIVIIVLLNILFKNNENFDDFSPYNGYKKYPFVYLKNQDNAALEEKLRTWETPMNTHNEGYTNAEPYGSPPLVPLYSYDQMNKVKFNQLYQ